MTQFKFNLPALRFFVFLQTAGLWEDLLIQLLKRCSSRNLLNLKKLVYLFKISVKLAVCSETFKLWFFSLHTHLLSYILCVLFPLFSCPLSLLVKNANLLMQTQTKYTKLNNISGNVYVYPVHLSKDNRVLILHCFSSFWVTTLIRQVLARRLCNSP